MKLQGTSLTAGVVVSALIVGGLIGWGVRSVTSASNMPPMGVISMPGNSSASTDQLTLSNLFMQHNALLTMYLQGFYDGKDVGSIGDLLQNNGQQIANFIGSQYGWNAQSDFLPMWTNHISEYKDYAYALKNNDTVGMDNAKRNLYDVAGGLGDYFHKLNGNISAEQVHNMMIDHINLMLSVMYAYGHQNQTVTQQQIQKAANQAANLAEYLAQPGTSPSSHLY